MSGKLRVGWHREHFLSPLLICSEQDKGSSFELVECPGGTGEMQVKLKNGEIDVCIGVSSFVSLVESRHSCSLEGGRRADVV